MNAPVLKTGRPKGLVSSNLTPSAVIDGVVEHFAGHLSAFDQMKIRTPLNWWGDQVKGWASVENAKDFSHAPDIGLKKQPREFWPRTGGVFRAGYNSLLLPG